MKTAQPILQRLRESSPNEGSHDLQCRCEDAANEIERIMSELEKTKKAVEFAEYMAKSGDWLLDAINSLEIAREEHEENSNPVTDSDLNHASEVRGEAYSALRSDIYEFRKRVARIGEVKP